MTNGQESYLSMFFTVALYGDANSSITSTLPNYSVNHAIVKNTIPQIQSIAELQKVDKKGITKDKNEQKASLIAIAADNARKISAFARFSNNIPLLGEVNISESDFKRCSDTALKDYAQIIYDRSNANLGALSSYNITEASQKEFLDTINSYNAALSTPRLGATIKSQATKQLVTLFETVNRALANMDAAVEIIRVSQPNFYNGYKTARKVIKTGGNSLMVKGSIVDAMTGEPLKGATLLFSPNIENTTMKTATNGIVASKREVVLTKRTAEKGGFNIKSLTSGVYEVTVKKHGYKEQVVTVAVTDGELSDLKIELAKN